MSKWDKTKATKSPTKEKVAEFLRENVFYKFGNPRELVTDQGSQFTSNMIEYFLSQHKIKHRTSTPYHPQANGHVEVTNRVLEGILSKVVNISQKYWSDRLVEATWAYNTTWKTSTRFTPYELVYGKKALLAIEFEYNTLMMAAQLDLDISSAQKERLLQLNGFDEFRIDMQIEEDIKVLIYDISPTVSEQDEEETETYGEEAKRDKDETDEEEEEEEEKEGDEETKEDVKEETNKQDEDLEGGEEGKNIEEKGN
eukprot:PITA_31576